MADEEGSSLRDRVIRYLTGKVGRSKTAERVGDELDSVKYLVDRWARKYTQHLPVSDEVKSRYGLDLPRRQMEGFSRDNDPGLPDIEADDVPRSEWK